MAAWRNKSEYAIFAANDAILPSDGRRVWPAQSRSPLRASSKPSLKGLAALRGREWVAGLTHGTIKVSVADVRVEHEVKMTEFTKWVDRPGGSPREMIQWQKVRSILGMPVQTS